MVETKVGVKVRVMGGDGGTDVGWKKELWSSAVEGARGCHIVTVNADIDENDDKVLLKKSKHCIEKAYCQCNWQRIVIL